MCDTAVVVKRDRVLFAKNSDRDPNEAQLLDWHARVEHPPGARVRCTWIEIPQARSTCGVLLSRPFWMWGAEMGVNDCGVAIGNEAVFTRRRPSPSGLTGMDLVRLGLERGEDAEGAVAAIVELLETHGQGGGCGLEDPQFSYHSSFLVADTIGAVLLETAGRSWAAEPVAGARSISNRLTIRGFAERHSARLRTWASDSGSRQASTERDASAAEGVGDMMTLLRRHQDGARVPRYRLLNGALAGPCVHGGGIAASAQTTASMVSELSPSGCRHWVTATAAPCTGIFKPVRVEEPLDLGPLPTDRFAEASLWWRHERLHRVALRDPERLLPLFTPERDRVEAGWIAAPPEPVAAFHDAGKMLESWTAAVYGGGGRDARPAWARAYWRRRDRAAAIPEARG